MNEITAKSHRTSIFIGGDYNQAKHICRKFTFENTLCVNVKKCDFIYYGGEQSGVEVELIQYSRFPSTISENMQMARKLCNKLMDGLYQKSATIINNKESIYITNQDEH